MTLENFNEKPYLEESYLNNKFKEDDKNKFDSENKSQLDKPLYEQKDNKIEINGINNVELNNNNDISKSLLDKPLYENNDLPDDDMTYLSKQRDILEVRNFENKDQIVMNRDLGELRQDQVKKELVAMYPQNEGYKIMPERYLYNKDGNFVTDSVTDSKRRLDFVVVNIEKNFVKPIEVTSETADKTKQIEKENRIRENGGNYIKDIDTNNLIEIPHNIATEIWRRM